MRTPNLLLAAALLLFTGAAAPSPAEGYDPLATPQIPSPPTLDLNVTWQGAPRDRTVPVRVYLPHATGPAPVLLFSHGLGGSRKSCTYLGTHWAARGYAAVFLQHPGSDAGVWQDVEPAGRMAAMKKAASMQNLMLRVGDVGAALDQLATWHAEAGHPLAGRLNLSRVGMSGHSFGALTTQYVTGMQARRRGTALADPRLDAALILSPSSPRRGDPAQAFGGVAVPWLLMTGTNDTSGIGGADLASRRAVYTALPNASKYELVLDGAEHSAFTDEAMTTDRAPRNPEHHPRILALSTAFWDAYLRDDADARAWLDGEGAHAALAAEDLWQFK